MLIALVSFLVLLTWIAELEFLDLSSADHSSSTRSNLVILCSGCCYLCPQVRGVNLESAFGPPSFDSSNFRFLFAYFAAMWLITGFGFATASANRWLC